MQNTMKTMSAVILFTLIVLPLAAVAQIPHTLSYQGILADTAGTPKPDGSYNFTFRLYTVASGGSPLWSETKSAQVKRGLFSTTLGSVTPIPDSVRFDQQYWLGVQLASDPEFSPRMQLASVGSSINSLRADVAQTVPDGSISSGKIAGGQVVKSINNLYDNLTMRGANGASVTSNGDTITITAGTGSGGTGIQGVQNTDNSLTITNPNGPTATINMRNPFTPPGNVGIGTTTPGYMLNVGNWATANGSTASGQGIIVAEGNEAFVGWGDRSLQSANRNKRWGWFASGGKSYLFDVNAGTTRMSVDGTSGNVGIGTSNPTVKLDVQTGGSDILHLTGVSPFMTFYDSNHGNVRGAIQQVNGGLNLFTNSYLVGSNSVAFMRLDDNGNLGIGSAAPSAKLDVASLDGDLLHITGFSPFITFFDSNHGYKRSAIQEVDGGMNLFADSYLTGVNLLAYVTLNNSGNLGIGTANPTAKLEVVGHTKTQVLEITGGSDLAEPFDTETDVEPGTVMIIDPDGHGTLRESTSSYDQRVAGIVSGAGGVNPGLTLRQAGVLEGSHSVAIAGRVYCKAEAFSDAIHPGDLLTTSAIRGHAMKATDREKSHGAIIGKAMTPLKSGEGLVLVLVNLQ
jgi:hypothetical protein